LPGFVIGAVGLAVGIPILVVTPKLELPPSDAKPDAKPDAAAAWTLSPWVAPGSGGIRATF